MKLSKAKKGKMKKTVQKRIKKVCGNMIDCHIYEPETDTIFKVVDQSYISNTLYLLAKSGNDEYGIFKIIKVCKYVKLSVKKILKKKDIFEESQNWKNSTFISISSEGVINVD